MTPRYSQPRLSSRSNQRGSMAIIVVGLFLPLLFFLCSLTLDVATYYTDQAKIQAALDETALYAYRFLPNIAAAESAATTYAQRFSGLSGLSATITDSTVFLRVERRTNLTFSRLVGIRDASLPLSVVSRVRGTPVDAFLVMDTSRRTAPTFSQGGWGDSNEWPAAQYFESVGSVSARSMTQRCFNPFFNALKRTAVDLYRYIGAASVNSVGLGFYTGSDSDPLVSTRIVAPLPRLPSAVPEVPFVGFSEPYVGPSLCAAAAERERQTAEYMFPAPVAGLASRGDFAGRPITMIQNGTRLFDPDYAPYLQGEELIWSQPSTDSADGGFAAAFRGALAHVMAGERPSVRGGLVGRSSRLLVWLASDLPGEGGIRFGDENDDAVRGGIRDAFIGLAPAFGDTGLTIFYVILRNSFAGSAVTPAMTAMLSTAIQDAAALGEIPPDLITVRVFEIDSPLGLSEQISRWLTLTNKTTVVAL